MKVVRLVIYEGDDKWVGETLDRSLKDGTMDFTRGNTLTIITLSTTPPPDVNLLKKIVEGEGKK